MAALLVGCGGSGDSSTSTSVGTGATSPGSETEGQSQPLDAGTEGETPHASKNPAGRQPQGLDPSDSSSLPNEGTKAVAPGVPITKGGDNSVQAYGVESSGDERAEAAGVVEAYSEAQVAGRWSEACALLAEPIKAELVVLAKKAGKPANATCPDTMAAFLGRVPKAVLDTLTEIHVLSMRVQGDRGFLIWEGAKATLTEVAMGREHGEWKVRALLPKELLINSPPE